MNTCLIFNRFSGVKRPAFLTYFLLWIFGLFAGVLLAASCFEGCSVIMKSALFKKPSCLFLVFHVISANVFLLELQHGFFTFSYLHLFLEALFRGFSGILVFWVCGTGAWLIRLFFLFSGVCRSVIIWWFIFRYITYRNTKPLSFFCFVSVSLLLIGILDILVISPYFIRLLSYI